MKRLIPEEVIENKIFLIRGQKVMLDKELAVLYGTETKILNQAVKRNIERFPADFMFSMNREEIRRMSQIVTSLKFSKSVYAFTEQGIAMLSSVLNSPKAIQVNIHIMRAFVKLRSMILSKGDLRRKIEAMERKYDKQFAIVFEVIKRLLEPPKQTRAIGFHIHRK